ncbi:hypothetical protein [Desulfotomaculum nigrificans]|uniref:hypothetical protein n=1 Tax=Desulfotomaculum nigrificans TaxID=1565 RepID=UPI0012DE0709|nr:hypothetical protein [Desulfotomaculum nigrificans]
MVLKFRTKMTVVETQLVDGAGIMSTPIVKTRVKIEEAAVLVGAYFYADLLLNPDYPNSSITSVYDPHPTVIGGTYSNLSLGITRKVQSGSYPATAKMSFDYVIPGVVSGRAILTLFVEDTSWYSNFDV